MDRNELDPSVPSVTEVKKIPLIIKVYAVLCILSGVGTLPSVGAFMWQVITALINGNAAANLGDNTLVAVGLIVAGIMLSAASAVILIIFWPGPHQEPAPQRRPSFPTSLSRLPSSSF